MVDGREGVFQAFGRAAGSVGSNGAAQQGSSSGGSAGVAAGLDKAASQVGAGGDEPIPLTADQPLTDLEGFAGVPPRLVRALNTTAVPDATTLPLYTEMSQLKGGPLDFAAPGSIEIRYLLRHIYSRLNSPFVDDDGRATDTSPWRGPDGRAAPGEAVDADEHWARRYEEAFSFLPYVLPVTAYSYPGGLTLGDARMLYRLQGGPDSTDIGYPLTLECQHSTTAAVITRGFDFPTGSGIASDGITRPDLSATFTAGPSGGAMKNMTPAGEARWVDYKKGTTDLVRLDPDFGPGSAFSFNDSFGTSQLAQYHPHIALVLRLRRDNQGRIRAIQFFDVGGMNVPETPHPAIERKSHSYQGTAVKQDGIFTYAYPWSASGKAGALGAYSGHSVLAPTDATRQTGINRLKDARPLGVAQLLLVRRHNPTRNAPTDLMQDPITEWLLYASPMVLMYEDTGDPYEAQPNYAPSRYLWSIRDLPGAEHIQAIWQISAPRSQFADGMAIARGKKDNRQPTDRSTTLLELVTDAADRSKGGPGMPTWNIPLDGTGPLPATQAVIGLLDLSVGTDGKVYIHDACRTPYKSGEAFQWTWRDIPPTTMPGTKARSQLPWGKATTHAASVDLATFTDLPAYFADPVSGP